MSDVVSEAPPAAGSPDRGASAERKTASGIHVRTTPPLTWLAVAAALLATGINQILLPALNDPKRSELLRELSRWGAFATNLATIAGGIALGVGLFAFVRYSSVMGLRQRLLLGAFGGLIFLPTLASAALMESQNPARIVLFAFGAAQILVSTVSTTAARAAEALYPRLCACLAAAMAVFALLAQLSMMFAQFDLGGWHMQAEVLHGVFQGIGEIAYLLLLLGMTPLLVPRRRDRRSGWARQAGFFVLPIVLGTLYLAELRLDNDYALLLYHAQRVTLFIDSWPRLYSVPIGIALAATVSALVAKGEGTKQAAAGVLLLLASGCAPHAPGRLLTWTLALVLIARAIIAPTHSADDDA
jgi:hypothetical protein